MEIVDILTIIGTIAVAVIALKITFLDSNRDKVE